MATLRLAPETRKAADLSSQASERSRANEKRRANGIDRAQSKQGERPGRRLTFLCKASEIDRAQTKRGKRAASIDPNNKYEEKSSRCADRRGDIVYYRAERMLVTSLI